MTSSVAYASSVRKLRDAALVVAGKLAAPSFSAPTDSASLTIELLSGTFAIGKISDAPTSTTESIVGTAVRMAMIRAAIAETAWFSTDTSHDDASHAVNAVTTAGSLSIG